MGVTFWPSKVFYFLTLKCTNDNPAYVPRFWCCVALIAVIVVVVVDNVADRSFGGCWLVGAVAAACCSWCWRRSKNRKMFRGGSVGNYFQPNSQCHYWVHLFVFVCQYTVPVVHRVSVYYYYINNNPLYSLTVDFQPTNSARDQILHSPLNDSSGTDSRVRRLFVFFIQCMRKTRTRPRGEGRAADWRGVLRAPEVWPINGTISLLAPRECYSLELYRISAIGGDFLNNWKESIIQYIYQRINYNLKERYYIKILFKYTYIHI